MSRKNLINLSLLLILLLLLVFIFWNLMSKKTVVENPNNTPINNSQPTLMTTSEKQELGIPDNLSVEILNRNKDGQITTYKLIKSE